MPPHKFCAIILSYSFDYKQSITIFILKIKYQIPFDANVITD